MERHSRATGGNSLTFIQLTLLERQVDETMGSRVESVDTAEHDLATLYERKNDVDNATGNQDEASSTAASTAKVSPSLSEQDDISMRQQEDESINHVNKKDLKKTIEKVQELFRDHEREVMENRKQQCHVLRQGFQRIEKKMDSMAGALNKVHKSILSLSQGMLTLARQTAVMNAELVKANSQIASTFHRLIQLKELELSKKVASEFSIPTQPSASDRSFLRRRARPRGGRRLST